MNSGKPDLPSEKSCRAAPKLAGADQNPAFHLALRRQSWRSGLYAVESYAMIIVVAAAVLFVEFGGLRIVVSLPLIAVIVWALWSALITKIRSSSDIGFLQRQDISDLIMTGANSEDILYGLWAAESSQSRERILLWVSFGLCVGGIFVNLFSEEVGPLEFFGFALLATGANLFMTLHHFTLVQLSRLASMLRHQRRLFDMRQHPVSGVMGLLGRLIENAIMFGLAIIPLVALGLVLLGLAIGVLFGTGIGFAILGGVILGLITGSIRNMNAIDYVLMNRRSAKEDIEYLIEAHRKQIFESVRPSD